MKIKLKIDDIECEAETDFHSSEDHIRAAQFSRLCAEINDIATKLIKAKYNSTKGNNNS